MESASEEDRRILQEMVGRFGSPAFIRRARLVETSWQQLLDTCAHARLERLAFVGLRLGQLYVLAGGWDEFNDWLSDEDIRRLQNLHDELRPQLRLPLDSTTSTRVLRGASQDLIEAMTRFNERWSRWLAKVDLSAVNKVRENYNRYYIFEKECAVGSAQVARMGFQKLAPMTAGEVASRFPMLIVPQFTF